ncbi:DNA mismatch repair protein MutL [Dictyocoela muelleri]|nr:DNA mismatch repair protein MutL [Dictyocoela muelleri]
MTILEEIISEIFKGGTKIIKLKIDLPIIHFSAEHTQTIIKNISDYLNKYLFIIDCYYIQEKFQKIESVSYNMNVAILNDSYGLYVYIKFKFINFSFESEKFNFLSNRNDFIVSEKNEDIHKNSKKYKKLKNQKKVTKNYDEKNNTDTIVIKNRINNINIKTKPIINNNHYANYTKFINFQNNSYFNDFFTPKNSYNSLFNKIDISNSFIIGQLESKFILCKVKTSLFIIDQHALHERIRFEMNRKETDLEKAKSIACRGAIKFGDSLTMFQMYSLLRKMKFLKQPFICVHGRPSIVQLK